jgi:ABC-type multidrug transport system fused ATPase/permease subunit
VAKPASGVPLVEAAWSGLYHREEQRRAVAAVRESGGGKWTILNLIPRFPRYHLQQRITRRPDVRYVTEVAVFSDTVLENVACSATGPSDERIIRAASNGRRV